MRKTDIAAARNPKKPLRATASRSPVSFSKSSTDTVSTSIPEPENSLFRHGLSPCVTPSRAILSEIVVLPNMSSTEAAGISVAGRVETHNEPRPMRLVRLKSNSSISRMNAPALPKSSELEANAKKDSRKSDQGVSEAVFLADSMPNKPDRTTEITPGGTRATAVAAEGARSDVSLTSDTEKRYIAVCAMLTEEADESLINLLDRAMLIECSSTSAELALEKGLIWCSRYMQNPLVKISCLSQCLFLRHWLILPDHVRNAHPELMFLCFKSFEHAIHHYDDTEMYSAFGIWLLTIQQKALSTEQRQYLYCLVISRFMASHKLSSLKQTSLAEMGAMVFTTASDGSSRWNLVQNIIDIWLKNETSPHLVAYLVVRFLAVGVHGDLLELVRAPVSVNFHSFEAKALNGLHNAETLCRNLSHLVLNTLLTPATRAKRLQLILSLLNEFFKLLWGHQLAPAELFLTSMAAEVLNRSNDIMKDVICVPLLRIIACFQQWWYYLRGPATYCSVSKAITCPGAVHQALYLASLQCQYKKASLMDIYAASHMSVNSPVRYTLTQTEWRFIICQSQLPQKYDALSSLIISLAGAHGLSEPSQLLVLRVLKSIVEVNPSVYSTLVLGLLERLTYSSPPVAQALVALASVTLSAKVPESYAIMKRIGVRLFAPSSKPLELSIACLLSTTEARSEEVHRLSLFFLLSMLACSNTDVSLTQYLYHGATKLLFIANGEQSSIHDSVPPTIVIKALDYVEKSGIIVKFGFRKLVTALPSPQLGILQNWMAWFCRMGNIQLVCLLCQFGRILIPREQVSRIIDNIGPEIVTTSMQLNCLASHLSLELSRASLDPVASQETFSKLYNFLASTSSRLLEAEDIESLSLSLCYCVNLCHPQIRKYREDLLLQLVNVVSIELRKFEQMLSARDEGSLISRQFGPTIPESRPRRKLSLKEAIPDEDSRQHLLRMIRTIVCIKNWPFVNDETVSSIMSTLVSLYLRSDRGDRFSSLLIQTIFGTLNRRRIFLDQSNRGIPELLQGVTKHNEELDILTKILLAWDWTDSELVFESPLLTSGWFGTEPLKRIFQRILNLYVAVLDRPRFSMISECFLQMPELLDHCMPRIISLSFSHNAIVAQWALETYIRLCSSWKTAQTVKVMRGLQIASRIENRHTAPFGRVWGTTIGLSPTLDPFEFVGAVAFAITHSDTSEGMFTFLVRGVMTATISSDHSQIIQDKLAMAITRSESLGKHLDAKSSNRLREMRHLEQWLCWQKSTESKESDERRSQSDDLVDSQI